MWRVGERAARPRRSASRRGRLAARCAQPRGARAAPSSDASRAIPARVGGHVARLPGYPAVARRPAPEPGSGTASSVVGLASYTYFKCQVTLIACAHGGQQEVRTGVTQSSAHKRQERYCTYPDSGSTQQSTLGIQLRLALSKIFSLYLKMMPDRGLRSGHVQRCLGYFWPTFSWRTR